jgi:hypothetical protein
MGYHSVTSCERNPWENWFYIWVLTTDEIMQNTNATAGAGGFHLTRDTAAFKVPSISQVDCLCVFRARLYKNSAILVTSTRPAISSMDASSGVRAK